MAPLFRCEVCGNTTKAPQSEAMPEPIKGIWPNYDGKYDLQLDAAFRSERRLTDAFATIELKSERFIWETSGNLCIEFRHQGNPSGIAVTTATMWVHELVDYRDETTVAYLMVPMERMKQLAREAWRQGRVRHEAGDRGECEVVLLPISRVLAPRTQPHDRDDNASNVNPQDRQPHDVGDREHERAEDERADDREQEDQSDR